MNLTSFSENKIYYLKRKPFGLIYQRSQKVPDKLSVDCFGHFNSDQSLTFEVTYWSASFDKYIARDNVLAKQKMFLQDKIFKLLNSNRFTEIEYKSFDLTMNVKRYNDFKFIVHLKKDFRLENVLSMTREDEIVCILNEKIFGDLLFDLAYSMKGKLLLLEP